MYNANVEVWLSILKLAHIWQFPEVRALALRSVEDHELDPIKKVCIGLDIQGDEGTDPDWIDCLLPHIRGRP